MSSTCKHAWVYVYVHKECIFTSADHRGDACEIDSASVPAERPGKAVLLGLNHQDCVPLFRSGEILQQHGMNDGARRGLKAYPRASKIRRLGIPYLYESRSTVLWLRSNMAILGGRSWTTRTKEQTCQKTLLVNIKSCLDILSQPCTLRNTSVFSAERSHAQSFCVAGILPC
jgi:hypothetical protein